MSVVKRQTNKTKFKFACRVLGAYSEGGKELMGKADIINVPPGVHAERTFFGPLWLNLALFEELAELHACAGDGRCPRDGGVRKMFGVVTESV